MHPIVKLTVIQGKHRGEELTFNKPKRLIVGRATDCSPNLPVAGDPTVSRHHCRFLINPPCICVKDCHSLNGTYVNEVKIGQRAGESSPEEPMLQDHFRYRLEDGDEVRVGNTIFLMNLEMVDDYPTNLPEEAIDGSEEGKSCRGPFPECETCSCY